MQGTTKGLIKETLSTVLICLAIVIPVRTFIAQPFIVSGESMDNTFHNGNYVIIDQISYKFEKPERGEVIVFRVPPEGLALLNKDTNKTIFYIKRVIGLPGEMIEIDGDKVIVYNQENTDGFELEEPYIYINKLVPSAFSNIHKKVLLGPNEYFVMGDNRHNSSDSRMWGPLSGDNIKGRTLLRLFPPNALSIFPGNYNTY